MLRPVLLQVTKTHMNGLAIAKLHGITGMRMDFSIERKYYFYSINIFYYYIKSNTYIKKLIEEFMEFNIRLGCGFSEFSIELIDVM
jgi:hypothetical protein